MSDYIFNPTGAPRRKYTIKPTWDGHYTGINSDGDICSFSLKYTGYLHRPETPGYSKQHFEYECEGEQTIEAGEGWEINKPTEGSKGGVCGYCGNSYLIIFAGYWREDDFISECYNYENVSKSGFFNQTTISYDGSGTITSRTTDREDFDIIDYNNTSLKGRWWLPIINAFPVGNNDEITDLIIEANFPIFDNYQHTYNYLASGGTVTTGVVNDGAHVYDDATKEYYIYNTYSNASVSMGVPSFSGTEYKRYERIQMKSTPALYKKGGDFEYHLAFNDNDIVGSCYSSTSVFDVEVNPQWTEGVITYTQPFYKTIGNKKISNGTYMLGRSWDTNIPVFNSMQDAVDFLNGDKDISEAENWDDISGDGAYSDIIGNYTGQRETATQFGGNYSENVFSHDYILSRSELATIGGKFFDTNVLSALLDGLKLYGNNPMDAVLSCLYFPFDLSTICTASGVTDLYFGSYKMESVSAKLVSNRSGYIEMGSTFIKPTFNNWLDYKAMHVYLYLAYIGFVELDINKYINKTLKIIYMIDIHSGECEVSLLANNLLMDTYSGQIGIKQPITYNDLSSYYQSQITALRNGVMSVVGGPIAGAGTGAQIGSSGGPYGMLAGAVTGASIGQTAGMVNGMWQGWKVANTKPPLFSKGGYSSEIGANMPQYCFLIFMYNDVETPTNLVSLYGKPSNKSGTVGSFSGFLSTNYVKLQCPTATDEEKNEIVSLLNSGIYI